MILKHTSNWFSNNPKKLFLLDGFGALLSAFLLGIVLVRFQSMFGIPVKTLYFLAFLPCLFAAYDFVCFGFARKNHKNLLQIIAIANLFYCFLSAGLAINHVESITTLGFAYLSGEIVIIVALVILEWRTTMKMSF